jgi:Zn-dependent protease
LLVTASLRFGRIAGIPVGASWSALLIALLIAWSLAGRLLPAQAPGLVPGAYWLAGLAGAGLFLGSLLAHEVGHALVARRAGLRVRGITLWLLGGVALLEDEPVSPRDELRVALVGPAVSLALAVAFGLAAVALSVAGSPAVAVAVAAWLAVGNLALALFNLLPAAPLDGGRVLRGLLWRRSGNRARASVVAATAGQWVGAGLIGYGLLGALTGWGFGSLWTALVG